MHTTPAPADAQAPLVGSARNRIRFAIALVGTQILAALFFVVDSLMDAKAGSISDSSATRWFEVGVAAALLFGIFLGASLTRRLLVEARDQARIVRIARGAFATLISERFAEWRLTAAEADVAMFALKGCTIAQTALFRGAAEGTVRAQLSQVYAKAGVSSQSAFVALFIEDMLGDTCHAAP